MKIIILNIGRLSRRSREIADMMTRRSINTLCLQETRQTEGKSGGKAKDLEGRNKLFYSGGGKPRNEVGICLKKERQVNIIEINRKSDRIILMKLITSSKTYNCITAYVSQQGCKNEEKVLE